MKKSSIPKLTKESKTESLSFDEVYQWLRAQEGTPSYSAVKDGKLKDGTQLYSIGLGHQIQPNESYLMTALLNDKEVLEIFKKDIEEIRSSMNKVIKVPINKNQQLALLSLRYNIGGTAFNKSTLLRRLNEGNFNDAAMRFAEWRLSEGKINQGLVNRRERERQLFSKPV
jgi:lysozyme